MMPMAVTMGDASGIGPEIILRRYAAGELDLPPPPRFNAL